MPAIDLLHFAVVLVPPVLAEEPKRLPGMVYQYRVILADQYRHRKAAHALGDSVRGHDRRVGVARPGDQRVEKVGMSQAGEPERIPARGKPRQENLVFVDIVIFPFFDSLFPTTLWIACEELMIILRIT